MDMTITTHYEDSRLIMDQFYNKISMESVKNGAVFHKVPLTKNMISIEMDEDLVGDQIAIAIHTYDKDELEVLTAFINDFEQQSEISQLIDQGKIYFKIVNQDALIIFEDPYFPKFNIDNTSVDERYINITLNERGDSSDATPIHYTCELSTNGDPSLAYVIDQVKSQFYGRRWNPSIIKTDVPDHIMVYSEKAPLIGFAQNYEIPIGEPSEVRCTCSITCPSDEDAANVGDTIYRQLVGRYEYINNQIILNIDGNMVYIIMSADSNAYPIILFDIL